MESKDKKAKLSSIKDEVNEFHPLLDELFSNFSEIKHVQYSHGQSEMGADFILARYDNMIEQFDYIGVVVKVGKIKQDHTDVERQIKECGCKRILAHTNTEGYLNSVWVISNDNITEGARRKIAEEHKNTKVVFIDQEKLVTWIDKYFSGYWEEMSVGISTYIKTELEKCVGDDTKLSLLDINNRSLYIEQDIVKNNREKYTRIKNKLPNYDKVNIYNEIESSQMIIIEGGMGSGKSKLLRKIFEHYCNVTTYKEKKYLPIRISFNQYINEYNGSSDKFLDKILENNKHIDLKDISQFLLLIDAVDEISTDFDKQMKLFDSVLPTTLDSYMGKGVKSVFSIREVTLLESYQCIKNLKRYLLKPLNNSKMFELLCNICKTLNQNDRLLEDLKKSELFKDMPKYPISALLLAKLINEGNNKDLPMNITELYSQYSELCLGRWDIDKGIQGLEEFKIAKAFTLTLAKHMYENERNNLSEYDVRCFYEDYIEKRNFSQKIDKDDLYNKIIYRSGMFAKIELDDTVIFKHRTFIEFFYAQQLCKDNKSILDYEIFSPSLHNITMFYIGIKNDCEELLLNIIETVPKNEFETFYKPFALADYLLAGYASPYYVVKDNIHTAFVTFAKFYNDIINKKIVLTFSALPEAQLLWLFQAIMREKYSYSFFIKSLDDACYKIETTLDIDNNIKAIALFLVGCIKLELKMPNPFDFLIEFHEKDIPIAAKLIVYHEADDIAEKSQLLRKLTKKVKKDMQNTQITYKNILNIPIMPIAKIKEKLLLE